METAIRVWLEGGLSEQGELLLNSSWVEMGVSGYLLSALLPSQTTICGEIASGEFCGSVLGVIELVSRYSSIQTRC